MARIKILLIFFTTAIITIGFIGCSQAKLPPCVPKSSHGIIIRWGEINSKNNYETFYELTDNCKVKLGIKQGNKDDTTFQSLNKISIEKYCDLYRMIQNAITKTQALNSPGEISNFVEYIDKSNGVYFRALWNREYTNAGNKQFRAVFDSLQTTISGSIGFIQENE